MKQKDQRLFAQAFVVGVILNWTFMAPWHELAHVFAITVSGGESHISGLNTTSSTIALTPFILMAAPIWEMITWPAFIIVSRKMKRSWFWDGLFWGNLMSAYLASPFTTDLTHTAAMVGIDRATMSLIWWLVAAIPIMVLTKLLKGEACRTDSIHSAIRTIKQQSGKVLIKGGI